MKYASEDLRAEHEGVLLGLRILERMSAGLKGGEAVAGEDVAGMVNFLKLFADKCHHGKEEGIFFPQMEKYGIPNRGGPIGQMLLEHDQGRAGIAGMEAALVGGRVDAALFARHADAYIALMRDHIAKENDILFPLADQAIPAALQSQLAAAFEQHEETVMGAGTHEQLHRMLDAFSAKYLT